MKKTYKISTKEEYDSTLILIEILEKKAVETYGIYSLSKEEFKQLEAMILAVEIYEENLKL